MGQQRVVGVPQRDHATYSFQIRLDTHWQERCETPERG
jgi:hypothetical protein